MPANQPMRPGTGKEKPKSVRELFLDDGIDPAIGCQHGNIRAANFLPTLSQFLWTYLVGQSQCRSGIFTYAVVTTLLKS